MIPDSLIGLRNRSSSAIAPTLSVDEFRRPTLDFQATLDGESSTNSLIGPQEDEPENAINASVYVDVEVSEGGAAVPVKPLRTNSTLALDRTAVIELEPINSQNSLARPLEDADASARKQVSEHLSPVGFSLVSAGEIPRRLQFENHSQRSLALHVPSPEQGKTARQIEGCHTEKNVSEVIGSPSEDLKLVSVEAVQRIVRISRGSELPAPAENLRAARSNSETKTGGYAIAIPETRADVREFPVAKGLQDAASGETRGLVMPPASKAFETLPAEAAKRAGYGDGEQRVAAAVDRIGMGSETKIPVSKHLHFHSGNALLPVAGGTAGLADQSLARGTSDRNSRGLEGARGMDGSSLLGSTPAAPAPLSPTVPSAVSVAPPAIRIVAEAVATAQRERIEVSLSPEELGRVRILISQGEGGLHVTILSDRDETLALLRRHAIELSDSFREIGLGSADIDFGEEHTADRQRPHGGALSGSSGEAELGPDGMVTDVRGDDRLDIRL